MNSSQSNTKDISKQLEYVKQQEQLRALGNLRNNPKPLSADSMIEDLLSKKETFQKRSPDPQQKQEATGWLCGPVPPMYSQVWASVQSANGLADTPTLSGLLMSSGLPTDTLAYIWSLANRTVPGALIQQEVYLVLALVALLQSGYQITNLTTVLQLPQAPIPALDLSLLPSPRQQMYPSPLSVTSLPDPQTYNWVAPEIQPPSVTDKIGVSYVSSGPMVSPKLLSESSATVGNFSFSEFNTNSGIEVRSDTAPSNASVTSGFGAKNTHTKHSNSAYNFSFPSLNESPTHIANLKAEEPDPFDEEFTDFQSADFTSVSTTTSAERLENPVIEDDDEFTNFQKASPKFDDDLSVLVIDGKNIPSAQTLWVADTHVGSKQEKVDSARIQNPGIFRDMNDLPESKNLASTMKSDRIENEIQQRENKYDVFQEIDDDRFSVFHNPLPDDEDKHSVLNSNTIENTQLETKSIFSHSLFSDPNSQPASIDFSKSNLLSHKLNDAPKHDIDENDDDEFSTFQNFPVSFPDTSSVAQAENIDKYDVFRTIIFADNSLDASLSHVPKVEETKLENSSQVHSFEAEMDLFQGNNKVGNENDLFGNFMVKPNEDIQFGKFQESAVINPRSDSSNIDNLFSSLAISEKTCDTDPQNSSCSDIGLIEDRYKALRLLEENPNEADEFGEFLGADVPNFGNQPTKVTEKPSIQVRCLEACLNLLKDGLSTLSRASSQDVVSEVLSDPRASTYLDCLLEVHRVSERIISNLDSNSCTATKNELHQVWESLGPYFTHTEHNHLTETVGAQCGVCRSNTGPSPITFGAMTFHSPCANLYLHCVEPVLPNIVSTPLVS